MIKCYHSLYIRFPSQDIEIPYYTDLSLLKYHTSFCQVPINQYRNSMEEDIIRYLTGGAN